MLCISRVTVASCAYCYGPNYDIALLFQHIIVVMTDGYANRDEDKLQDYGRLLNRQGKKVHKTLLDFPYHLYVTEKKVEASMYHFPINLHTSKLYSVTRTQPATKQLSISVVKENLRGVLFGYP